MPFIFNNLDTLNTLIQFYALVCADAFEVLDLNAKCTKLGHEKYQRKIIFKKSVVFFFKIAFAIS